jgi:signal transduction histidine kinase
MLMTLDEIRLIGDGTGKSVMGQRGSALDGDAATTDSSRMERSRRGSVVRIFGVATAFGIFSGLQAYNYVSLFSDGKDSLRVLLALNITYWYGWAVLVPGMVWMARRYRFERPTLVRSASMHALGVIVFVFAHAVLATASRVAVMKLGAGQDAEFWRAFRQLFFLYFDWEMMTYWAVIGLSNALDFRRESQERALTAAQLQTRLIEAQLQALQRQIHPHFLFNTLNTISALMHRDPEAADAMLAKLSDLLRLTLNQIGTQYATVKEEIDFLEKYLDIERTRYGDRLQVLIDVDPATLDAVVPNLLLQPLVENALRHGIGPKVVGGRIDIVASRDGDRLQLIVRDDGYGMSADELKALNTGVGLRNTRSRLEHMYGEQHLFEFRSVRGGGLEVIVEIPFTLDTELANRTRMESVA